MVCLSTSDTIVIPAQCSDNKALVQADPLTCGRSMEVGRSRGRLRSDRCDPGIAQNPPRPGGTSRSCHATCARHADPEPLG